MKMNVNGTNTTRYEAMAVADAISKGLTEAPEWTLDETMNMMKEMDEIRKQLGVVYPTVTAATATAPPATSAPASPSSDYRPTSPLSLKGHYRRRSLHRGNEEVGENRPLSPLEFAPTTEPDMHVDLVGNYRRPLRAGAAGVTNPYHHVPDQLEHRPATAKPNWYGDSGTPAQARQAAAKPNWYGESGTPAQVRTAPAKPHWHDGASRTPAQARPVTAKQIANNLW